VKHLDSRESNWKSVRLPILAVLLVIRIRYFSN
jgi:hypothetical protein